MDKYLAHSIRTIAVAALLLPLVCFSAQAQGQLRALSTFLNFDTVDVNALSRSLIDTIRLTKFSGEVHVSRSWSNNKVFSVFSPFQQQVDTIAFNVSQQQTDLAYTISAMPNTEGEIIDTLVFTAEVGGTRPEQVSVAMRVFGRRKNVPPSPKSFFHLSRDSAAVGDTAYIAVIATRLDTVRSLQATGWRATLKFNQSLLVPQVPVESDSISGMERFITLSGNVSSFFKAGDTLMVIPFTVTLGDAEQTPVIVESMTWLAQGGAKLTDTLVSDTGNVFVRNLWRHGGLRLVNPNTGSLRLHIYADNTSRQLYANVFFDTIGSALGIYDIMGNKVADATNLLPASPQQASLTVDISALPHGLYFCRLSSGSFTIVRSFAID